MPLIARAKTWLARPLDHKVRSVTGRVRSLAYRSYMSARGYDFDGFVPVSELDATDPLSKVSAGAYQAYPVSVTVELVGRALATCPAARTFVDVGCGKGKQCHYVAKHFDFSEIIGMDFSPALIAVANRNLSISGHRNTRYEVADATTWLLPDAPGVVFLYNSFDVPVMRAFLENNRAHFIKHGSIMAYGNDRLRDLVQQLGFTMVHRSAEQNNSLFTLTNG